MTLSMDPSSLSLTEGGGTRVHWTLLTIRRMTHTSSGHILLPMQNKEWQQAPPLLYGCLDESSSQSSNIVSKVTHQTPVGNAAATAAATFTALIRDTFHRYAGQLAKWCCHSESESELWPGVVGYISRHTQPSPDPMQGRVQGLTLGFHQYHHDASRRSNGMMGALCRSLFPQGLGGVECLVTFSPNVVVFTTT
ncbi:hypothetical protein ASPTUDRAFT_800855 [Aspergillus tubingensis CBS 134.48]|uniref:Uncharacterized protein n=1 Tax=Aspergillus tubingensis (strain CBS 134.48) TaxID=767770 RepID=A0A1L9MVL9_ASPTC|nr:hypothetical protein ASPTUDRAFT_800855 [Aspergillus tubingensis CBS 134.48]